MRLRHLTTYVLLAASMLLIITLGAAAQDCECPDGTTAVCFGIGATVTDGSGVPIGGAPQAPGTSLSIVAAGWIPECDPIQRCAPIAGGEAAVLMPAGDLVVVSEDAPQVCPGALTTLGTAAYVVDPGDVNPQLGVAVAVVAWGATPITPGAPGPQPGDGGGTAGIGIHVEGAAAATCPGDVNGDGQVDVADLVAVIEHWGEADPRLDAHALANGHPSQGVLDIDDLILVLAAWGDC